MVPYDGQVIEWMGERIVLDIKSMSLRKDVIPAFVDHDPSRIAGEIDKISVENNKVTLSGEFLETSHAVELQAKKKLQYECSMSFYPNKSSTVQEVSDDETLEANGRTYEGPLVFLSGAQIHESSFTYYGAVDGARAEFSQSNKEDSMSGQEKGGEPTPQISAQDVLSKMVELSGDKAFATDCFLKGVGIEEFKDRLNVSLSEKNKELSETNVELSKEIVELKKEIDNLKKASDDSIHAGADGGAPDLDFVQLSQKYAKDHGVSLSQAMSIVSVEHADVYAKFTRRS
jgi:hypothetical protein